jgi:exopolysaccharide biosynthesis polyprenyl glycosylphosphotransferase
MAVDVELLALEAATRPPRGARRHRTQSLRRQLLTADMLAGAAGGAIAASVSGLGAIGLLGLVAGLAIAWPIAAFVCGLYAREDLRTWASGVSEAPKLMLTCLALSWPLLGCLMLLSAPHPARGALVATLAIAVAAGLTRAAARVKVHRAPELQQRTLIVGSGVVAERLVERLYNHPELGLRPIGYVDDDDADGEPTGLPRLGGLRALPGLIADGRVDRVMVAFSRAHHEDLLEVLRVSRDAGIAVDVIPRLFEFLDGARTVDQIGGLPLLSIDVPTFSPLSRATKRGLDIVGASLALLVLSPILIAISIAIKLDSRGPVLFRQARSGRGGLFFTVYKFRSMRAGSTVEVRDDGAIVKHVDDARITRVGRVIRRFSLDEAPQLLNVLKGDMSLVGPRPLVTAEAAALTAGWHARRADLRPGLTGPWQIAGRSNIPFHEMIRFDYQYVAGWSLARDIEILLATVPAVISGRGAY